MQRFREVRTITGQKIFVWETEEQRLERILFRFEIVLAPLAAILVWAAAAGMI